MPGKKIEQETSELTQEKRQKRLTSARMSALIGTLTYSATLWGLITFKLPQKILQVVCFKIFAVIGFVNAGLAIADAWTSPDQKIEKAADAANGLAQAILIGTGVFGASVIAASVAPYLFISAISLWIAHDTYKCIKNYWHYRALCKAGLKASPEAQTHLARAKIHGFSAVVGAVTLIGMVAMMGLIVALAANPVTGPLVWAFSAVFALYLTVKTISNTKWGQKKATEWAKKPPKIVAAYRWLDKVLITPTYEFIKNQAKKCGQAPAVSSAANDTSSTAQTAPPTDTEVAEQAQLALPTDTQVAENERKGSPVYQKQRENTIEESSIETSSIEAGLRFLIKEIDEKTVILHKKIFERRNLFELFMPINLHSDKRSFLLALRDYLVKYGKSSQPFEDFFKAQKEKYENLDIAYVGLSDTMDIVKAAQAWIQKKNQPQSEIAETSISSTSLHP